MIFYCSIIVAYLGTKFIWHKNCVRIEKKIYLDDLLKEIEVQTIQLCDFKKSFLVWWAKLFLMIIFIISKVFEKLSSIYLICILQFNKVVLIIILEMVWVLGYRTVVTCRCFQKLSALSLSFIAVSSYVVVMKSCGYLRWFEIYPVLQRQTLIWQKIFGWLRVSYSDWTEEVDE